MRIAPSAYLVHFELSVETGRDGVNDAGQVVQSRETLRKRKKRKKYKIPNILKAKKC